jgi:hypothetical protein
MNAPAFGRLFFLEPDVLEIPGIPQRVEVPIEGSFVVDVTGPGEDSAADGVRRNSPVAVDHDLGNDFLLAPTRRPKKNQQ